jgi:hypothetical protein
MSKPLADFYDHLLPELPGCTTELLDHHLRSVAREFCHRTSAWRLPFDDVDTAAGVATYDLIPSESESDVVRLTKLTVNGTLLWRDADENRPGEDTTTPAYKRESPPFSVSVDNLQIMLAADEIPSAAVAAGLKVVGALKPSASARRLPDFLLSEAIEAIRAGVLSRLMLMSKKPWTDRELAVFYQGKWNQELNFWACQTQRGNTRQILRVKSWG